MQSRTLSTSAGLAALLLALGLLAGCSADISGTYEARDLSGGMRLTFAEKGQVHVSVFGGDEHESADGIYEVDGDRITIRMSEGGDALTLTRNGDDLVGRMPGEPEAITFRRK